MMKSQTNLFSELDHSISMDIQEIYDVIENLPRRENLEVDQSHYAEEDQEDFFNRLRMPGTRLGQGHIGQLIEYEDQDWFDNIYNDVNRLDDDENLDDEPTMTIDGSIFQELGFEILAYYVPFHFHNRPRPWGIYLRRVGIAHVRQKLLQFATNDHYNEQNFGDDLKIPTNVAVNVLLLHELKHHAIEVGILRRGLTGSIAPSDYYLFVQDKRRNFELARAEEAICNANILSHKSKLKTDFFLPNHDPNQSNNLVFDWTTYVTRFMDGQPSGYNAFRDWRKLEDEQLQTYLHSYPGTVTRTEFNMHSNLSILKRLPVPTYLC